MVLLVPSRLWLHTQPSEHSTALPPPLPPLPPAACCTCRVSHTTAYELPRALVLTTTHTTPQSPRSTSLSWPWRRWRMGVRAAGQPMRCGAAAAAPTARPPLPRRPCKGCPQVLTQRALSQLCSLMVCSVSSTCAPAVFYFSMGSAFLPGHPAWATLLLWASSQVRPAGWARWARCGGRQRCSWRRLAPAWLRAGTGGCACAGQRRCPFKPLRAAPRPACSCMHTARRARPRASGPAPACLAWHTTVQIGVLMLARRSLHNFAHSALPPHRTAPHRRQIGALIAWQLRLPRVIGMLCAGLLMKVRRRRRRRRRARPLAAAHRCGRRCRCAACAAGPLGCCRLGLAHACAGSMRHPGAACTDPACLLRDTLRDTPHPACPAERALGRGGRVPQEVGRADAGGGAGHHLPALRVRGGGPAAGGPELGA